MLSDVLEGYGHFVARHPYLVLGLVALLTLGALQEASTLSIEETRWISMFPKDLEVIRTMHVVQDEFAGAESMNIVIELDPDQAGFNAFMDVREPKVIEYADMLARKSEKVEYVLSATSVADVLRNENGGKLPASKKTVVSLLEASPQASRYVTSDYSMTLVRVNLGDIEGKEEELMSELRAVISSTAPPAGIKADVTGDAAIAVVFREATGPDMAKTTRFSFVAIFVIAVFLFRSIKHGVIPIVSVGLGLLWAFGLMGVLGINLSANTAGFASMVIGIGIDFAIQVINRFRNEKYGVFGEEKKMSSEDALAITLSRVIVPMGTTTLAALIGFRAMALGELTVMAELGNAMSLGVLASMATAVTLVPSLLIIGENRWL